jgi:HK97 family phage prohead protease
VLALAERNDLGGMSFGFSARDEHVDGSQRELRAVDLFEISVVSAFPAYEGTVINARAKASSFLYRSAAARRLRLLELVK